MHAVPDPVTDDLDDDSPGLPGYYQELADAALTPSQLAALKPAILTKIVRGILDGDIEIENASQAASLLDKINKNLSDADMAALEEKIAGMTPDQRRDALADIKEQAAALKSVQ